MADNEKGTWADVAVQADKRLNRTNLVKDSENNNFSVAFRDISHPTQYDLVERWGRREKRFCKVEFIISRGNQDFTFPIFIETNSVDAVDYIREAAHRLHLDLARLAEQTKHFKLRDEDAAETEEENPFI